MDHNFPNKKSSNINNTTALSGRVADRPEFLPVNPHFYIAIAYKML